MQAHLVRRDFKMRTILMYRFKIIQSLLLVSFLALPCIAQADPIAEPATSEPADDAPTDDAPSSEQSAVKGPAQTNQPATHEQTEASSEAEMQTTPESTSRDEQDIGDTGPVLELPPEDEDEAVPPSNGPSVALPPKRSTQAIDRIFQGAANAVTIAGYGELHYTRAMPEDGDATSEIDMHRLVLYVGKQFNDKISFSTELEVEHAIAGEGKVGEFEVEQAIVDYRFTDRDSAVGVLGMRAGIMLVPMGIVNQWHEPPLFHGVERPRVDELIIPSTWREGGIGIYHRPSEDFSYELYLMGGLDPAGFSPDAGIRRGRQFVGLARADGLAFTGRGEYQPNGQTVIGLSGYFSQAGKNSDEIDANVNVLGVSADARSKYRGIEAKAEFAMFTIGDTDELNAVVNTTGSSRGDVGRRLLGAYAEIAYDIFHTMDMEQQLLPFARFEYTDTNPDEDTLTFIDVVGGLTFRPIPQVVFKADVTYRRADGDIIGDNATLLNLGVGFLY
tara:strand:+ start:52293 stop:53798 length:1506 start_codon:yes stop_codon:yes gene_type:complete